MALMDDGSCECLKSELDLFSSHVYQLSIDESKYEKYYPVTSLTALGPIEFRVVSGDEDYLDLQNSFLYMKCRILDPDGGALKDLADNAVPDEAQCYPINYFFATQFKSVEVSLNNKQVSGSDVLYAQKAYIESLLTYGHSKQEQLECAMFAKDGGTAAQFETFDDLHKKANCKNPGAQARYEMTKLSKPFEMCTPKTSRKLINERSTQAMTLIIPTARTVPGNAYPARDSFAAKPVFTSFIVLPA